MKKKIILAGLLCCMCLGLTACGNPLKQLPEALDENIYDTEEGTTGNEAADEIIDVLTDEDEDGIDGDVTAFAVYDRDDDEEDKDQSDLSVEIVIETDDFEYTGYYIVTMKYDKEDGWEVDEFVEDEDEDYICKPLEGVSVDEFEDYIGYEAEGMTMEVGEPYEEDGVYFCDATAEYEYSDEYCTYSTAAEITFEFCFSNGSKTASWEVADYVDNSTAIPNSGVSDTELHDTIYWNLDSFTTNDGTYFYIENSSYMGDITPLTNDFYEENGVWYNELTVEFDYIDSYGSYGDRSGTYTVQYYMMFEFTPSGYWELIDYTLPTDYVFDSNVEGSVAEGDDAQGVDEDILYDTIFWYLDSFTTNDGTYFYILSDNMGDIVPLSNEVYEENGTSYNELTVQFDYIDDDGTCAYRVEYYMLFVYGSAGWELIDYELPTEYELIEY